MLNNSTRRVTAVVVAFGTDEYLPRAINALLLSTGVELEVIVVDNGSHTISQLPSDSRITILNPGHNTGFAGGCNLGASCGIGEVLVFVNSDALVHPTALTHLYDRAILPQVGLVCGLVLLADQLDIINSCGNPIHFSLLSWAGQYGEPKVNSGDAAPIAGISGALFGARRHIWEELGGFDDTYFAYNEDVDLSLRTWIAGYSVWFDPSAIAHHYYEFARHPTKFYLLERNRLVNLLTLYESSTLLLLLPALILIEVGITFEAIRSGWIQHKIQGWAYIINNLRVILHRRRIIQRNRRLGDRIFAQMMASTISPPDKFGLHVPPLLNHLLRDYWLTVLRIRFRDLNPTSNERVD